MIADSLDNIKNYKEILPFSKEILAYLDTTDISSLAVGKYPIVGDDAFLLIQEYETKLAIDKVWEAHKKYIDILIVLDGEEVMEYAPITSLKVKEPYDEAIDAAFYENGATEPSFLITPKNCFCIFFPADGHKPGLHITKQQHIKKAVIKVLM